jgi:hypothetical protein
MCRVNILHLSHYQQSALNLYIEAIHKLQQWIYFAFIPLPMISTRLVWCQIHSQTTAMDLPSEDSQ